MLASQAPMPCRSQVLVRASQFPRSLVAARLAAVVCFMTWRTLMGQVQNFEALCTACAQVLVPASQFLRSLVAARLAADVSGILCLRTLIKC